MQIRLVALVVAPRELPLQVPPLQAVLPINTIAKLPSPQKEHAGSPHLVDHSLDDHVCLDDVGLDDSLDDHVWSRCMVPIRSSTPTRYLLTVHERSSLDKILQKAAIHVA